MHIKHQKTEEVGRCPASLWLKRTVNVFFLFLGLLGAALLRGCAGSGREAITAGAGGVGGARGPRSRAAAQKRRGRRRFRKKKYQRRTTPRRASSPALEHLPSVLWAPQLLLIPDPLPPLASARAPRLFKTPWEGRGWRIGRLGGGGGGGLSNMTEAVCLNGGRGGRWVWRAGGSRWGEGDGRRRRERVALSL